MSKILVTGHSGCLGSNLVKLLEEQGHEVLGVSRTNRYNFHNSSQTDLTDKKSCDLIFNQFKPEIVYHLAANASEAMSQKSPSDMTSRNLLMSCNVLASAIKVKAKKIVYASSVSVYGDAPTPYSEYSQPQPKDVYGVNKYAFEQVLKIMSKVYGIDYTIFRPHNLYGPGQVANDLSKNVINIFMRKLLLEEGYTILGGAQTRRAFSYVGDVASVFAQAVDDLSGVIMNVGSKNPITIDQLSDYLIKISGKNPEIDRKPLRDQEISEFIADHKLQDKLVEYKDTPVFEGLKSTWEFISKQKILEPITIEREI